MHGPSSASAPLLPVNVLHQQILWRKRESVARSRGQSRSPLLHLNELMLPPQCVCIALFFCGMAAAFSTAATAQNLISSGAEYRVGGALPGDQVFPALGLSPAGGYLVWQDSKIDRLGEGIAGVRLDGSGEA